MRKKIKQLTYGIFEDKKLGISFSTERIEQEITEGKDLQGEFTLSGNGKKVRGIVYSTCYRMECLTPQFDSEEIRIRYQFHAGGLTEGETREGEFVIVCDKGEYHLPFIMSVSKKYAQTSIGVIRNLDDFTALAKENFSEAYRVFYSVYFLNLLKETDEKAALLYEVIRKEAQSMQSVEAFLIGIEKKDAVKIALEKEEVYFSEITASRKELLCLKQEGWGYVFAKIKSDTAFLHLEKTSVSSEDFLGNTCFIEYYIDADAMHAGKNFGRITIELQGQIRRYEICAVKAVPEEMEDLSDISRGAGKEDIQMNLIHKSKRTVHQLDLRNKTALMQLYIDYRLKKIVTGVWAKESIRLLEQLLETDAENDMYRLMKAQAFLTNRQRQEAIWILEAYKREAVSKDTPEWGYYLYLTTLMEREESYVNRAARQIEELFHLYPDNSVLFWIRLFVKEDYCMKKERRLKAIECWIEDGHNSPYFYLEAYQLYMQDPYLFTRLNGFGLRILNWAGKQKAITQNIAMQIVKLVSGEVYFDERVFALLLACYELGKTEENVTAICSYLIRGQKFEKKYHKWYALGIEYEARITNLYEAYLLSADEESINHVPKAVLMYFQYHNTLSYKKLALLYVYIIKNKEKSKSTYIKYRKIIEQFVMAQIRAGHIDENLAFLYQEMLPLGILDRELAEKFSDVLFAYRLTVGKDRTFTRAIIAQKQWKQASSVQIVGGEAYFSACTDDYCILLQDADGLLYTDTNYYKEYTFLKKENYLPIAEKLAPNTISYLVNAYAAQQKEKLFTANERTGMKAVMEDGQLKDEWKFRVFADYIRSMEGKELDSFAKEYLKNANYHMMSAKDRSLMIEQLARNQLFELAYEMMKLYGYDLVTNTYQAVVCSNRITEKELEEDEFLLRLAADIFFAGKYDAVILNYLCGHYHGPAADMVKLWETLRRFEIAAHDLEERILSQILYTGKYIEQAEAIYESYSLNGGNEQICIAYLTWISYLYVREEIAVQKFAMQQNERRLWLHQDVNDVQKFAVLKYYAELEKLNDSQYHMADTLLLECTTQSVYFSFYKKLPAKLQTKYQIYDKYYIEHFLNPGTKAKIYYNINADKVCEEELKEVYDGVYVKEMVLFAGDKVDYSVRNVGVKEFPLLVSAQIAYNDTDSKIEKNRYTMLNDMLSYAALEKKEALQEEMSEYQKKKISTEAVFKLL